MKGISDRNRTGTFGDTWHVPREPSGTIYGSQLISLKHDANLLRPLHAFTSQCSWHICTRLKSSFHSICWNQGWCNACSLQWAHAPCWVNQFLFYGLGWHYQPRVLFAAWPRHKLHCCFAQGVRQDIRDQVKVRITSRMRQKQCMKGDFMQTRWDIWYIQYMIIIWCFDLPGVAGLPSA